MSKQQQTGHQRDLSSQLKDFIASWKLSESDDVKLAPEELSDLVFFVAKHEEQQPRRNPNDEMYYYVISRWYVPETNRLHENRNYPNKDSHRYCTYSKGKGDKDWIRESCY
ncbi:hypothetical protein J2W14_002490 [Pseudarthrobacter oxydans]|jgi:hypothetical protein|uniref:hypothetical protein n=1 Tax=Pseudarthrobacter oxydans TaxID=1671 RepID=UPI002789DFA6|nr:hypothetical protein [Pseudarthrobacter oxydans]MDP9983088.1 hypothetical protein [Pseudarthrobacter oxydans]